ncbi:YdbL family protein [Sphingomonas piscis]|uniref:YdbL family protein n=2 Tax=Sphingomonas piscis TaxID=2714943 RepID=A0A6G7YTL0_9SPHN|nr:YdbL family protein [Sphingomonas piscis]
MIGVALALALTGTTGNAQTPALNQAFAAGQIGERYDGYLGVVGPVSTTVRSQVATINIRRRSLYNQLAGQRRVAPQEVGITAGCQLLRNTGPGEMYLLAEGGWRRRVPGQAVQLPEYCR